MKREEQKSGLPPGFKRLEYLESNGTQYIDTGVSVDNTIGFELTFQLTSKATTSQANGQQDWINANTLVRIDPYCSAGKFRSTLSTMTPPFLKPYTRTVILNGIQFQSKTEAKVLMELSTTTQQWCIQLKIHFGFLQQMFTEAEINTTVMRRLVRVLCERVAWL